MSISYHSITKEIKLKGKITNISCGPILMLLAMINLDREPYSSSEFADKLLEPLFILKLSEISAHSRYMASGLIMICGAFKYFQVGGRFLMRKKRMHCFISDKRISS